MITMNCTIRLFNVGNLILKGVLFQSLPVINVIVQLINGTKKNCGIKIRTFSV